MRFVLTSFAALGVAALAVAQSSRPLNPPLSVIRPIEDAAPAAPAEPLTNAKRFALNMPPASPKAHRRLHRGVSPHGGSRVRSAPRAATSPTPPVSNKCNILVKDSSTGQELGFISREWNSFAEYGPLQSSQIGALEVAFSYSSDSLSQLDLLTTNSKSAAHPFMGASLGYGSDSGDIGPGNTNYLFLTGSTQTPAGSPPSYEASNSFSEVSGGEAASETAIWTYDPLSRALTSYWTNSNRSVSKAYILWSSQEGNELFTLTGDPALFMSTFGIDAPEVTFICVPSVTAL
ncbi:hypothetical protein BDV93DRAFT_523160 [Ceratobasidium sp. AG-I]|nr:hypothetical protein BDV93DRAFT_523160 [Ceratobasidium sp. AG-I]